MHFEMQMHFNSPFRSNRHVRMASVQCWKCQKRLADYKSWQHLRHKINWLLFNVSCSGKTNKTKKPSLYASLSTWQYKDSTNSTISFKDCQCKFAQWIDLKKSSSSQNENPITFMIFLPWNIKRRYSGECSSCAFPYNELTGNQVLSS